MSNFIRRNGLLTIVSCNVAVVAFAITFCGLSKTQILSSTVAAVSASTASASTDVGLVDDLEPVRSDAASNSVRNVESSATYIQEGKERSSFRPNFSSSFRTSNQRNNFFMLRAFQEAVGENWKHTVQLLSNSEQIALGAIVGSDGWIITKASEMPSDGNVQCHLFDGSEFDAELVTTVADLDLALLRIPRSNLPVIQWDENYQHEQGKWLATTDTRAGLPTAVGVVSAGPQRVYKAKAVLGVHLVDSTLGAAITLVLPGSGAEEAGLKIGDSIYKVNGQEVFTRDAFLSVIRGSRGGEVVKLGVNRADKIFDAEARLMDLADELLDETEMEVNGRVSSRATGFNEVFMHDTVLDPSQCGGPLVSLDGKAVGLNIARAGRVCSYALPAHVVKPVVDGLIEQAKLVSRPLESNSKSLEIR